MEREIKRFQTELGIEKRLKDQAKQDHEDIQVELDALLSENEGLRNKLRQSKQDNERLQDERQDLIEEYKEIMENSFGEALEARILEGEANASKKFDKERTELVKEMEQYRQYGEQLEEENNDMKVRMQRKLEELKEVRSALSKSESYRQHDIDCLLLEKESLKAELKNKKTHLASFQENNEELLETIGKMEREMKQLQRCKSKDEEVLSWNKSEKLELEKKLEGKELEIANLDAKIEDLEASLHHQHDCEHETNRLKLKFEADLTEMEAKVSDQNAEVANLMKLNDDLTNKLQMQERSYREKMHTIESQLSQKLVHLQEISEAERKEMSREMDELKQQKLAVQDSCKCLEVITGRSEDAALQLQASEARNRQFEEDNAELAAQLQVLAKEINEITQQQAALQDNCKRFKDTARENEEAALQHQKCKADIKQFQHEKAEQAANLQALTEQLGEINKVNAALQKDCKSFKDIAMKNEKAALEQQECEARNKQFQEENAILEAKLQVLMGETDELNKQNAALQDNCKRFKDTARETEEAAVEHQRCEGKMKHFEHKIAEQAVRLQALTEQLDEVTKKNASLQESCSLFKEMSRKNEKAALEHKACQDKIKEFAKEKAEQASNFQELIKQLGEINRQNALLQDNCKLVEDMAKSNQEAALEHQTCHAKIKQFEDENAELAAKLQESSKQLFEINKQNEVLKDNCKYFEVLAAENKEAAFEHQTCHAKIKQFEDENAKQTTKLQESIQQLNEINGQNEALEENCKYFEVLAAENKEAAFEHQTCYAKIKQLEDENAKQTAKLQESIQQLNEISGQNGALEENCKYFEVLAAENKEAAFEHQTCYAKIKQLEDENAKQTAKLQESIQQLNEISGQNGALEENCKYFEVLAAENKEAAFEHQTCYAKIKQLEDENAKQTTKLQESIQQLNEINGQIEALEENCKYFEVLAAENEEAALEHQICHAKIKRFEDENAEQAAKLQESIKQLNEINGQNEALEENCKYFEVLAAENEEAALEHQSCGDEIKQIEDENAEQAAKLLEVTEQLDEVKIRNAALKENCKYFEELAAEHEVAALEHQTCGDKIKQSESEMAEQAAKLQLLTAKLDEVTKQNATLKESCNRFEDMASKNQKAALEQNACEARNRQFQEENAKMEAELQEVIKRLDEIHGQNTVLKESCKQFEERALKNEKAGRQLKECKAKIKQFENQRAEQAAKVQELNAKLNDISKQNTALQDRSSRFDLLTAQIEEAAVKILANEAKLTELEERNAELTFQLLENDNVLEELRQSRSNVEVLKRQASELEADLQAKDSAIADIKERDYSLTELKEGKEILQNEVATLKASLQAAESKLIELKEYNEILQNDNTDMKTSLHKAESKVTELKEDDEILQNEVTSLKASLQAAESKITELKKHDETLQNEITNMKESLHEAESKVTELKEDNKILQNDITDTKGSLQAAELKITELKEDDETLQNEITDVKANLHEAESKVTELKEDNEILQNDITDAKGSLQAAESKITELKEDNETLQNDNTDMNTSLHEAESKTTELKKDDEILQNPINDMKASLHEAESKLTELKEGNEILQNDNTDIKASLHEAESKVTELKEDNEILQNDIIDMNCCLQAAESKFIELKEYNEILQKDNTDMKTGLREADSKIAANDEAFNMQLQDLRDLVDQMSAQEKELTAKNIALKDEIKELKYSLKESESHSETQQEKFEREVLEREQKIVFMKTEEKQLRHCIAELELELSEERKQTKDSPTQDLQPDGKQSAALLSCLSQSKSCAGKTNDMGRDKQELENLVQRSKKQLKDQEEAFEATRNSLINKLQEAEKKCQQSIDEKVALEAKLNESRAAQQDLDQRVADCEATIAEKEAEIMQNAAKIAESENLLDESEEKRVEIEDDLIYSRRLCNQWSKEMMDITTENAELKKKLGKLDSASASKENTIDNKLKEEITELRENLTKMTERERKIQDHNNEMKKKMDAGNTMRKELEHKITELNDQLSTVRQNLEQRMFDYETVIAEKEAVIRESATEILESKQLLNEKEEDLRHLEKGLECSKTVIDKWTIEFNELIAENDQFRSELGKLRGASVLQKNTAEDNDRLKDEIKKLQESLKNMKEHEREIQDHNYEMKKRVDAGDKLQKELEQQMKELNNELSKVKLNLEDAENEIKVQQKERHVLKIQNDNWEELKNIAEQQTCEVKAKDEMINQIDAENRKFRADIRKLEFTVRELEDKIGELESEKEECQEMKEFYQEQFENRKDNQELLERTENDLKQAYEDIQILSKKKKELVIRCQQLEDEIATSGCEEQRNER